MNNEYEIIIEPKKEINNPYQYMIKSNAIFSQKYALSSYLIVWWITSSGLILLSFIKELNWLGPLGGLISIGYVIVLIRHLHKKDYLLLNIENVVSPFNFMEEKFWRLIGVLMLIILMIFVFGLIVGPAIGLLLILNVISVRVIKHKSIELNQTIIMFAFTTSIVVFISILLFGTHDISWAIFMGITTFNLGMGGLVLQYQIPLTKIQALAGQYSRGMKSFIIGGLLALPLALLNILGKIYKEDTWISHWWDILYALSVGIGEEIWARLFLLSFLFILILPSTKNNYAKAILVAIIFSSIFHGFAHSGINPVGIIIGSLIYGIPTGYLYLKRDFEHVVGFHFFIDFIRFSAAYYIL